MSFRPNPKPEKRQKEKRKRMMRVVPTYKKVEYKPTGEAETFKQIAAERADENGCFTCCLCGEQINETLTASNFPHYIPKSFNKELRLVKENIGIAHQECHAVLDFGTMEQKMKLPKWNEYLKTIKLLDVEYFYKVNLSIFKHLQNKALKS